MSISTVAQVRTSSKSTRSARTLLLVIASHVNPDTGWAWPSLDTLAHETGLQRRRTIDLIHILERLGELEVRRGQGRGHVNFYRVHVTPEETVQSSPKKGAISPAEKVQSSARKGAMSPQEKMQSIAPESKREREKKGAPAAPVCSFALDKPERHSRWWCEAHGFCHSERLDDHRPDCAAERLTR
jgi:Helix-turn-helix domain